MATIPARLYVNFDEERLNLINDGLDKLLWQFVNSCVLRQFISAFTYEADELHDCCIDLQEGRQIFTAEGVNLDALGRIVGQDRRGYQYDDTRWMYADRQNQKPDNAPVFVENAPMAKYEPEADSDYKSSILVRVAKNHTIAASVPEINALIRYMLSLKISFIKVGPMCVELGVPASISYTALAIVSKFYTNTRADHIYMLPYPATLNLCEEIYFIPDDPDKKVFIADRMDGHQCDVAPCAVSTTERL